MISISRWAVKKQDPSEAANDNLPDKWARQGLTWPVNEADTWAEVCEILNVFSNESIGTPIDLQIFVSDFVKVTKLI